MCYKDSMFMEYKRQLPKNGGIISTEWNDQNMHRDEDEDEDKDVRCIAILK